MVLADSAAVSAWAGGFGDHQLLRLESSTRKPRERRLTVWSTSHRRSAIPTTTEAQLRTREHVARHAVHRVLSA